MKSASPDDCGHPANTNTHSGDGGLATAAGIGYPSSVVLDVAGNLYIGETYYYVRRVAVGTGIITSIAGISGGGLVGDGGPATSAGMTFVSSLAMDAAGNIFVGDGGRIRRIDAASGTMTTVAGTYTWGTGDDGVHATQADLPYTLSVAVDGSGNIWLTTASGNKLRAIVAP